MTGQRPKTVLVTGGGSGIGLAVVHEFARLNHRVVVLDREDRHEALPAGVELVVGDVTEAVDNERAVSTALRRYGRLDVFVGNAGIHDGGAHLRDLAADELAAVVRKVIDVDVIGYLLGARAAVDSLLATGGCMIFTLSDASFLVRGNGAGIGYTAAKHAALGLMRHLAADLAPRVRVNAVAPGGVITDLQAVTSAQNARPLFEQPDAVRDAVQQLNPLGIILTPEQIAPL
ncbi:MAG TPA: SDR family NAD(P)-dependent oxidoreductase, partial [Jiangellaceae bacterium]|nr:SDR family NAD(P)-dependent oxidoreductase [Jiangellaceae bacterium]